MGGLRAAANCSQTLWRLGVWAEKDPRDRTLLFDMVSRHQTQSNAHRPVELQKVVGGFNVERSVRMSVSIIRTPKATTQTLAQALSPKTSGVNLKSETPSPKP